jgi:hypothetical protein
MNKIKVGISCEGPRDLRPLITITSKILKEHGLDADFPEALRLMPYTGILGFVKIHTRKMFADGADIAVYCTDQDRCEDNITNKVKDEIRKVNPVYVDLSAIGIPEPHFESWLLADENNIKSYFKLDGTKPVPHSSLEPKSRLAKLQDEMPGEKISIYEIAASLAETCDIDRMKVHSKAHGQDFNRFYNELSSAIKTFLAPRAST